MKTPTHFVILLQFSRSVVRERIRIIRAKTVNYYICDLKVFAVFQFCHYYVRLRRGSLFSGPPFTTFSIVSFSISVKSTHNPSKRTSCWSAVHPTESSMTAPLLLCYQWR